MTQKIWQVNFKFNVSPEWRLRSGAGRESEVLGKPAFARSSLTIVRTHMHQDTPFTK